MSGQKVFAKAPLSLAIFESAARNGNLTRAAEEYGISQPAVSRHIRKLEDLLGVRLFEREARGISLTAAGQKLQSTTERCFAEMFGVLEEIETHGKTRRITIRSIGSLLNSFVIPALASAEFDRSKVRFDFSSRSNSAPMKLDICQIALIYGSGNWPGMWSRPLIKDNLIVVGASSLDSDLSAVALEDAVVKYPLLQLEGFADPTMNWRTLLDKFGLIDAEMIEVEKFDDYETMIQACKAGRGLAIISWNDARTGLDAGDLVACGQIICPTDYCYHLVCDPIYLDERPVRKVIDLLSSEGKALEDDLSAWLDQKLPRARHPSALEGLSDEVDPIAP